MLGITSTKYDSKGRISVKGSRTKEKARKVTSFDDTKYRTLADHRAFADPSLIDITTALDTDKKTIFTSPTQERQLLRRRVTFPPIIKKCELLDDDEVTLNIGGSIYTTTGWALSRERKSWLSKNLSLKASLDRRGRQFIDRDGQLFSYVLRYLETGECNLPTDFKELDLLKLEAIYYDLSKFSDLLEHQQRVIVKHIECSRGAYITLTEHATFNIRFRENVEVVLKRISSITVAGHVRTCRKLFATNLSMDRDSNDNDDRYSCRMFLICLNETTNFDMLKNNGYELVVSNEADAARTGKSAKLVTEQYKRWIHVTNYYFRRTDSKK